MDTTMIAHTRILSSTSYPSRVRAVLVDRNVLWYQMRNSTYYKRAGISCCIVVEGSEEVEVEIQRSLGIRGAFSTGRKGVLDRDQEL